MINNSTELMKKYNIRATKRFGQNFLKNNDIINKIIDAANIDNKEVVEIGPGLGALTFPLLKKVKNLMSYEIDKNIQLILEKEIDDEKFTLIKEDFLKSNLKWKNKKTIVANIPYNITTPIIFKIIENNEKINSAILMVQKEYAERILANPKTKPYGKLSVSLQSIADIEKIILVKNDNFIPKPKVDSMVIKISFKETYSKEYFLFVLKCFAQKRKTLINNLKQFNTLEDSLMALKTLGLNEKVRPQELSVSEYQQMWKILKK